MKEEKQRIPIRDKRKLHADPAADSPDAAGAATSSESDIPIETVVLSLEEPSEVPGNESAAGGSQYLEDLQRLKAEFENYRKRVLKEQTALVENASVGLVARLLGVLDNFELAVAAAEQSSDFERMLKGVEMVFGELKEVLRSEGLAPIEAKGADFDPTFHEAALEVPGDDSGRMVVSEVLRPGYLFKSRVLRPAMVKVTQQGGESGDADGNES
ncbi:MAG TPA: nucleotide exchange factor GrpE [Actinomycetota bacterium]|nr:nucleotide exchange factor GrpE [Actinomycetota bacterium]